MRYTHPCTACVFVGTHEQYDLYVCVVDALPSYVCLRWGDKKHEEELVFDYDGANELPAYKEAMDLYQVLLSKSEKHDDVEFI